MLSVFGLALLSAGLYLAWQWERAKRVVVEQEVAWLRELLARRDERAVGGDRRASGDAARVKAAMRSALRVWAGDENPGAKGGA